MIQRRINIERSKRTEQPFRLNSTEVVERTRAVIPRQRKSIAAEQVYLHWLRHYIVALGQMPTFLSSEQKLERFLTDLALRKNVYAATQNQAFNASFISLPAGIRPLSLCLPRLRATSILPPCYQPRE